MGKSIVITSGKGGVGKTTTSANLGMGLAMRGMRVALVDADIGLRNLDVVIGLENRIVYDIVDVAEGRCKLKNALIKDKRQEGLFLLAAAQTRDKSAVTPEQMKNIIIDLKEDFDFVIIDCPAGIEHGFRNAIVGADCALVVTVPEVSAVRDGDRIIGLLLANEIDDVRLIINRMRKDMVDRGDMLDVDDMLEILSVDLLGIVPEDPEIIRSSNLGEPVVLNSNSMSGQAYNNIVGRLLGETVPMMDMKVEKSFLQKMKDLFSSNKD